MKFMYFVVFGLVVISANSNAQNVVTDKIKIIDGDVFRFEKHLVGNRIEAQVYKNNNNIIEDQVPVRPPDIISDKLREQMRVSEVGTAHRVILSIQEPLLESDVTMVEGMVDIYELGGEQVFLNNVLVNEETLTNLNTNTLRTREINRNSRNNKLEQVWRKLLDNNRGWSEFSAISDAIANGHASVVLDLTQNEIRRVAGAGQNFVISIDVFEEGKDDIAGAMLETKIDPHAISFSGRRGEGIGIYMTESGCPNAGFVNNYTRLTGPRTNHSENVVGILRAASPQSQIFCRGGAVLPTNADLDSTTPDILLATRSNSSGNSTDYNTIQYNRSRLG